MSRHTRPDVVEKERRYAQYSAEHPLATMFVCLMLFHLNRSATPVGASRRANKIVERRGDTTHVLTAHIRQLCFIGIAVAKQSMALPQHKTMVNGLRWQSRYERAGGSRRTSPPRNWKARARYALRIRRCAYERARSAKKNRAATATCAFSRRVRRYYFENKRHERRLRISAMAVREDPSYAEIFLHRHTRMPAAPVIWYVEGCPLR